MVRDKDKCVKYNTFSSVPYNTPYYWAYLKFKTGYNKRGSLVSFENPPMIFQSAIE